MNFLVFVLFIAWVFSIIMFHNMQYYFYKFIVGSIGMFFFIMYYFERVLSLPLSNVVAMVAGWMGNLTNLYTTLPLNSLITISTNSTNISFFIDYECSGVVEIFAFSCLLWFYPLYHFWEKVVINFFGILAIFFANVIRIYCICFIINVYGDNMFFFAHTIFGRIIFYLCSVILYFNVFTKPQILRQKVGHFSYDDHP
ncbi:MAG: exosortase family protein XrtG [Hyphomonadaceae bacterium]|nr:exosortase family protein XrtG [Clostridia bacterium]